MRHMRKEDNLLSSFLIWNGVVHSDMVVCTNQNEKCETKLFIQTYKVQRN